MAYSLSFNQLSQFHPVPYPDGYCLAEFENAFNAEELSNPAIFVSVASSGFHISKVGFTCSSA